MEKRILWVFTFVGLSKCISIKSRRIFFKMLKFLTRDANDHTLGYEYKYNWVIAIKQWRWRNVWWGLWWVFQVYTRRAKKITFGLTWMTWGHDVSVMTITKHHWIWPSFWSLYQFVFALLFMSCFSSSSPCFSNSTFMSRSVYL